MKILIKTVFKISVATVCLLAVQLSHALANEPLSNQQITPVTIQLNWHHQFQFAGIYAAIKQGYYQDVGLQVTALSRKEGFSSVGTKLKEGVEFAIDYDKAVVDYLKGEPIKVVMASFQYSPLVFISKMPIHSLRDLENKKINFFENIQFLTLLDKTPKDVLATIELKSITANLEDFKTGRVDLYSAYRTNEPFQLAEKGIPFYILDPKSYGVQTYGDLIITSEKYAQQNPDKVLAFKRATIKGWQYAIDNQAATVDYILANYQVVKSRKALLAEAVETKLYVQDGNISIGHVALYRLQSIASNALKVGMLTKAEFNSRSLEGFMFNPYKSLFTSEEKAYLNSNPVVKLANNKDFGFIDSQGEYKGIAADYLSIISDKTGIKFLPQKDLSREEVVRNTEKGRFDLYPLAVISTEKQRYMNFTRPHLSFPMVVVSQLDKGYVNDINVFKNKVVAVANEIWTLELLRAKYPDVNVLLVNNTEAGLKAVSQGVAEAYIGNLAVINSIMQTEKFKNLAVVGELKQRFELSIGVQKDNPVLFSIIEKTLASITEQERQDILHKWFGFAAPAEVDYSLVKTVIVYFSLVLIILLAVVLWFRKQKRDRQSYIDQVHELTFATLTDMKKRTIIWSSDAFANLTGYSKEELYHKDYVKTLAVYQSKEQIADIENKLAKKGVWSGELQGKKKNGQSYWVDVTYRLTKDYFFSPVLVWATRIDITDKKLKERLSVSDELTGLYNRRYFNQVVAEKMLVANRSQLNVCALLIDIDWFKTVNDKFGHLEGDNALVQVANKIQACFHTEKDYVFRIGGEEFFVYCQLGSAKELLTKATELLQSIEGLRLATGKEGCEFLTVSIGAVFCPHHKVLSKDEVYSLTDENLYQAKSKGRNQVVLSSVGH